MKLSELLKGVKTVNDINFDFEITSITKNSKQVEKGGLFFVINGENFDGYNYIQEAVERGVNVIVTDRPTILNVKQIIVKDVFFAMSKIAYNFYKPKNKRVKLIGVIVTNVKTTTTYILKQILKIKIYFKSKSSQACFI